MKVWTSEGPGKTGGLSAATRELEYMLRAEFPIRANAAVHGAPNFASRLVSNFRSCPRGICNTAVGRGSLLMAEHGDSHESVRGSPRGRAATVCIFCTKVLQSLGGRQMGKFKNSAAGHASLIPIVRTTRSAGEGVTECAKRPSTQGSNSCHNTHLIYFTNSKSRAASGPRGTDVFQSTPACGGRQRPIRATA